MLRDHPGRVTAGVATLLICTGAWWFRDRTHDRVYRVGYIVSPSLPFVDEKGPHGPEVESINTAARDAGIRIEWVSASQGPIAALTSHHVDLWPVTASVESRKSRAYISDPYLKLSFWLYTREDRPLPPRSTTPRLAIGREVYGVSRILSTLPAGQMITVADQRAAMEAVCRGEFDGAVLMEGAGNIMTLEKPPGCKNQRINLAALRGSSIWFGVGASPDDRGAIQVADRLRDRIGDMIRDGRFSTIALNWGLTISGQAATVYEYTQAKRAEQRLKFILGVMFAALLALVWQRRKLHQARRTAEDASRAKTTFLANMSHEIRTPMNGVLGMTELMLRTSLTAEQQEYAQTVQQSGQALLAVINDILDMAKIEAGKMTLREAPFDAAEVLADVARLFHARALEKGIQLRVATPAGTPVLVTGDALRIRQILANLTSNAIKFTDHGSVTLQLETARIGSRASLRYNVIDTGIGIAPHRLPDLFRTYSQLENGHSPVGSSGLGLVISGTLSQLMGGSIAVASQPEQGSTFTFAVSLPVASALSARQAGQDELALPCRPLRILVVEDNPVNRRLAQAMLAKLGCVAELAAGGEQALKMIDGQRYDLILMDWHMPGCDGLETTRRLHQQWTPEDRVPVIALTAAAMEGDRERCLQAGMADYLTKPIELARLAEILERWSRTTETAVNARNGD